MEHRKNKNPYEDIIHLPHLVSKDHIPMSIADRAAQFSPFAALTGYDGAIKETARLTDQRIELDESSKTILDEKLRIIQNHLNAAVETEFVFFKQDEKKTGGTYITQRGIVKKISSYEGSVIMQKGEKILIKDIITISGELFPEL